MLDNTIDIISTYRYDIFMTKTVIALDPDVKQWLDHKAAREGVPMTELVRRAVALLQEKDRATVADILERSRGIWTEGDGLEYQLKIRDEWTRDWSRDEDPT